MCMLEQIIKLYDVWADVVSIKSQRAAIWRPWILYSKECFNVTDLFIDLSIHPDIEAEMAPFSPIWKAVVWCLQADGFINQYDSAKSDHGQNGD